MISITKKSEGCYLASLTKNSKVLNRSNCYVIKKELTKLIKSQREITLDLDGVKNIDFGGLEILIELKNLMDTKNCKFEFIHVDSSISKKISGVSNTYQQPEENMLEI